MKEALRGQSFDVVADWIAYTPGQAAADTVMLNIRNKAPTATAHARLYMMASPSGGQRPTPLAGLWAP